MGAAQKGAVLPLPLNEVATATSIGTRVVFFPTLTEVAFPNCTTSAYGSDRASLTTPTLTLAQRKVLAGPKDSVATTPLKNSTPALRAF